MSKNETNITAIVFIIIGVLALGFFSFRLVSTNEPESGEFESSAGLIRTELDSTERSIQKVIEGVKSTESGLGDVVESLERAERDNIESVETIDNNLSEHVTDSKELITRTEEFGEFDNIDRDGIESAREITQDLTELIQQALLLEQD